MREKKKECNECGEEKPDVKTHVYDGGDPLFDSVEDGWYHRDMCDDCHSSYTLTPVIAITVMAAVFLAVAFFLDYFFGK